MRSEIHFAWCLFAAAVTTTAADKIAPLNVKLGLWQMTYILEGSGLPGPTIPPELAAKMTPEQRAKTEARLKARAGQGPRLDSRKYCLTERKLNKGLFDDDEHGKSCQRTVVESNSKLQQFHEECNEGGTKRTAEGRFEAIDRDTMMGSIQVKTEGKSPLAIKSEIAGKWIGTDCGDESQ